MMRLSKPSVATPLVRMMSSKPKHNSLLRERFAALIPTKRDELNAVLAEHGETAIDKVTVTQIVKGGRGIKFMLWDASSLDANEGIRYRGLSIPEIQAKFPGADKGKEPRPESTLWLLLTGEVPTAEQEASVTAELHARSALPAGVEAAIRSFPKNMHPMTQLVSAAAFMQSDSIFAKQYEEGASKKELWSPLYDDVMNLIARLPRVAALIYRNTFKDGVLAPYNASLDYSANFCRMLGFNDPMFDELMRMYLTIHADHEGGNASAHTAHLAHSTLADPYLAYAASMCSLAGPLHGLANQEVLRWVKDLQAEFHAAGKKVTHDNIRQFAWDTLKANRVIPGFGHAVLRKTDPRYLCQREFAIKHLKGDELVEIVKVCYEVLPQVLTEHGKTANPFPNVDAHSGVLLTHYGLTEERYYTVLFGVSRAIGVLSQCLWDRALGMPLERPKSLTVKQLRDMGAAAAKK